MKVYNQRYGIQSNGSPIKFLGYDNMVDEINEAVLYETEEEVIEELKGKTDCKVISIKITYEF